MAELTLFDLNNSEDLVEELSLDDSKSIFGGHDRDHPDGGRGYERDYSDNKKEEEEELPDELEIYRAPPPPPNITLFRRSPGGGSGGSN